MQKENLKENQFGGSRNAPEMSCGFRRQNREGSVGSFEGQRYQNES